MIDVPPDVFPNILSRLPVETLLRFRCVCNSWRRLINDPAFVKLHLCHQSETGGGYMILKKRCKGMLYTLTSDSIYSSSQTFTNMVGVEVKLLETLTSNGFQVPHISISDDVMHFCNGLFLFKYQVLNQHRLILWNPFTRESFMLPADTYTYSSSTYKIGFGYDFVSDDYKVVKIVPLSIVSSWKTLVYSLKLNSWRTIKNCPSSPLSLDKGVYVNGMLHWLKKGERVIVAFDLATEDYHSIPLPNVVHYSKKIRLDALDECLLLTNPNDSVYCLDEYNVGKPSWTKLFSFREIGFIVVTDVTPIAYLKTKKEVLFMAMDDSLESYYFWVNIEKKSAKEIYIFEFAFPKLYLPKLFFLRLCTSSLVRLRNYGATTDHICVAASSNTNMVNDRTLKSLCSSISESVLTIFSKLM